QRVDLGGVDELAEVAAGGEVPDLGGVVLGAGGDHLAVGADGDGQDEVLVAGLPGVGLDLLAGGGFPDLDGLVEAAGDDVLAGGAEADGVDGRGVPLEGGGDGGRRRVGSGGAGAEQSERQEGEGQGQAGGGLGEQVSQHGRKTSKAGDKGAGRPDVGTHHGAA